MSRSGYSEDIETWSLIRWRGAVNSAIKGKRGQSFLKDLLVALDAMPEKKLISDELEVQGEVCALGALGKTRGIDMSNIDPYDRETVANTFDIAPALAAEVVYENDEGGPSYFSQETPEGRWQRMRNWIESLIIKEGTAKAC